LSGFTVALACFYRRSEPMHSLSAHLVKGWDEVSHGLYWSESEAEL